MSGGPCVDCFSGVSHEGNPAGTVTTIAGLPCYVSQPEDGVTPKGIIVIIPDAFGWEFVNNKLLSDTYAKRGGFLVYLPDFMNGHAMPASCLRLMELLTTPADWFTTIFYKPIYALQAAVKVIPFFFRNRLSVCKPRVFSFFQALRTSPPPFPTQSLKIGAAGFCWGGKHVMLLAHNTPSSRVHRHESQLTATTLEPLIDCGFTAHPSFIKVPEDIDAVNIPLSVAVGEEDMAMAGPLIKQMKEILEVKKKGDHEVVIMPGAKHGFAVRTNPKDKLQLEWADKAEEQAISWFTRWLT